MSKTKREKSFFPHNTKLGVFSKKCLRSNTGFTYIELVAVIAILTVLLGVAIIATRQIRSNDLDMAAELVQSALVEAREKAQAPRPSTQLDEPSDVNGYGVRFRPDGDEKQFQVFKDRIDVAGVPNEWDSTTDEIITTYKFADNNIVNVENHEFEKSDSGLESGSNVSIVFKTVEIPSQRFIYFNGDSSLDWVKVRLRNIGDDTKVKIVKVDLYSGEVKIETVASAIDSNTIALWQFNEGGTSQTTVNAEGDSALDGQLGDSSGPDGRDPTWTTSGKFGNALDFNGTNQNVRLDDNPRLNFGISGDFTVDAWIKTLYATDQIIYQKGASGATQPGYRFKVDGSGKIRAYIRDDEASGYTLITPESANTVNDGNWHHVAFIADRDGNAQIYIDGNPDGNPVSMATIGNINTTSGIIMGFAGGSLPFNGTIDEVRVSDIVRTSF